MSAKKLFLDFDSNKYPMFRISGSAEKGGKCRLQLPPVFCPLFVGFLLVDDRFVDTGEYKHWTRRQQQV